MRNLIIAVASALLLAVVVTELIQRLGVQNYLAILITTAIALFINGLFNQRAAKAAVPAPAQNNRQQGNRGQRANADASQDRNKGRSNERNNDRNDRNKDRNKAARKKPASSEPSGSNADAAKAAPSPVPSGPREQGEVKWFNRSKGFGFIIRESGDEIFVHQRSIRGADDSRSRPVLRDGEAVEFVVTEHDKGLQAEDVVATARG